MSRISTCARRSRLAIWVLVAVWIAHLAAAEPIVNIGLIRDGAPPDLLFLYTGDVIGYIEPCG